MINPFLMVPYVPPGGGGGGGGGLLTQYSLSGSPVDSWSGSTPNDVWDPLGAWDYNNLAESGYEHQIGNRVVLKQPGYYGQIRTYAVQSNYTSQPEYSLYPRDLINDPWSATFDDNFQQPESGWITPNGSYVYVTGGAGYPTYGKKLSLWIADPQPNLIWNSVSWPIGANASTTLENSFYDSNTNSYFNVQKTKFVYMSTDGTNMLIKYDVTDPPYAFYKYFTLTVPFRPDYGYNSQVWLSSSEVGLPGTAWDAYSTYVIFLTDTRYLKQIYNSNTGQTTLGLYTTTQQGNPSTSFSTLLESVVYKTVAGEQKYIVGYEETGPGYAGRLYEYEINSGTGVTTLKYFDGPNLASPPNPPDNGVVLSSGTCIFFGANNNGIFIFFEQESDRDIAANNINYYNSISPNWYLYFEGFDFNLEKSVKRKVIPPYTAPITGPFPADQIGGPPGVTWYYILWQSLVSASTIGLSSNTFYNTYWSARVPA